jgi:hypothetical protein
LVTVSLVLLVAGVSGCGWQSSNALSIAAYKSGKCSLLEAPETDDPTVNAWLDLCLSRQIRGCKTERFFYQDELLSRARHVAARAEVAIAAGTDLVDAGMKVLDADDALATHNDDSPPCTDGAAALYVIEHHATDTLDDAGSNLMQPIAFQDVVDRAQRQLGRGLALLDQANDKLTAITTAQRQIPQQFSEAPQWP